MSNLFSYAGPAFLLLVSLSCSSSNDTSTSSGGSSGAGASGRGGTGATTFGGSSGSSAGGSSFGGSSFGGTSSGGASFGGTNAGGSGGFPSTGGSGGFPASGGVGGGVGGSISSGGSVSNVGGVGGSVGGSGGTGGGTTQACTGRPGTLQGQTNQTVTVGGLPRTFIYYVPQGLDPNQPTPLVIVPHGFTMTPQMMVDITQYNAVADREHFVVVYPAGEGSNPWNVGTGVCGSGAFVNATGDDQSFVTAILQFVNQDRCLDQRHVFMSGFSMGGYFSHENGCLRSDIAGIGPHSGGTHDLSSCPVQHKPVIIFHFETDSLISYTCATDARDKWVAKNGCQAANPTIQTVTGGTCEVYNGCPADGQVVLCHFTEPASGYGETVRGHAWSGGSTTGNTGFAIPQTASATELGWSFFKQYAW